MQLRQELRLWFFSSSKKSQTLWSKRYVNKHAIDYTVYKNSHEQKTSKPNKLLIYVNLILISITQNQRRRTERIINKL